MKTLQQQQCLSPASKAGSFVSALIGLKASEKPYRGVLRLTKLKGEAGKKQQEELLQDVWIYITLLQNKTSLGKTTLCKWLWKDARDGDSDSWVGLNQVWAEWEMFGFWLICFLFLSYFARALTWHR